VRWRGIVGIVSMTLIFVEVVQNPWLQGVTGVRGKRVVGPFPMGEIASNKVKIDTTLRIPFSCRGTTVSLRLG